MLDSNMKAAAYTEIGSMLLSEFKDQLYITLEEFLNGN